MLTFLYSITQHFHKPYHKLQGIKPCIQFWQTHRKTISFPLNEPSIGLFSNGFLANGNYPTLKNSTVNVLKNKHIQSSKEPKIARLWLENFQNVSWVYKFFFLFLIIWPPIKTNLRYSLHNCQTTKIFLYYSSCTLLQLPPKHAKQHDNQIFPDFYEHISHIWNLGAWYCSSVEIPEIGSFQHYKSKDKEMEIMHKVSKITKLLEYLKNKLRKTGNMCNMSP